MKNPCDLVVLDPGTRVMDYVPTAEDLDKLLTQSIVVGLPDWIRHLFVVEFETGRRIGEIMKMRCEDLVLSPSDGLPYVWFWASKQKRMMRKPKPISARCADALMKQAGDRGTGPLWPCKNPPYKLLRESGLREAANWNERWFHDFRKSAAVRFRLAGGKEAAKGMLDHATDRMSEYYTHFHRKDLEGAILGSIDTNVDTKNEKGRSRESA